MKRQKLLVQHEPLPGPKQARKGVLLDARPAAAHDARGGGGCEAAVGRAADARVGGGVGRAGGRGGGVAEGGVVARRCEGGGVHVERLICASTLRGLGSGAGGRERCGRYLIEGHIAIAI